MELGGLQPDAHYMVTIQAVAFWGQKRLKSVRAQLSFKTAASTGEGWIWTRAIYFCFCLLEHNLAQELWRARVV